jgi:hypothetical protein
MYTNACYINALQFGRVAKDDFTMDMRWPFSPLQVRALHIFIYIYIYICPNKIDKRYVYMYIYYAM